MRKFHVTVSLHYSKLSSFSGPSSNNPGYTLLGKKNTGFLIQFDEETFLMKDLGWGEADRQNSGNKTPEEKNTNSEA